ncbi:MAG: trans-aconitate 2-methyltransferase [Rhizobiales bacterium]|nr:trans-aconitate 2-methyltransferase [Hyphomicrobiales bacterium]
MPDWRPAEYLAFANERARPALDLISRIPVRDPKIVCDLGCGPGNSTALLRAAFPGARITGADNSPAMLSQARAALPEARFIEADVASFVPQPEADLIFANAVFQWVPDHPSVLARLLAGLRPGGVLAVQMPDNLGEPSHSLMQEAAEQGPWRDILKASSGARSDILPPTGYYDLLRPLCSVLDIWHSIYNHPVQGIQGIVDFVASTGLRPYLDRLADDQRADYLDAYKASLAAHYPVARDGKVLFRFPRLFILAVK